jgi:hypothetical protein
VELVTLLCCSLSRNMYCTVVEMIVLAFPRASEKISHKLLCPIAQYVRRADDSDNNDDETRQCRIALRITVQPREAENIAVHVPGSRSTVQQIAV